LLRINVAKERSRTVENWGDVCILPGEQKNVELVVGASYSGQRVTIPVHVRRGLKPGPVVFISAAVHGDEINGTGTIRQLILHPKMKLIAGSLILVPVVNLIGFEQHSRYLPDRRDLNRSFPGSAKGSLASRLARTVMEEIIDRSDYGIDLHTAAVRRTNFPNLRADLDDRRVRRLAQVFGCEVTVNEKGPAGCLRRAACDAGVPTLILEAGEVWKVESMVIEYALRGIFNVLAHLGMIEADRREPPYRVIIKENSWVRSDSAGFLHFHTAPGNLVTKGFPIATVNGLVDRDGEVIRSTTSGIVLGMTTLPFTAPGEPVCLIGRVSRGRKELENFIQNLPRNSLQQQIRDHLATSIMVVDPVKK